MFTTMFTIPSSKDRVVTVSYWRDKTQICGTCPQTLEEHICASTPPLSCSQWSHHHINTMITSWSHHHINTMITSSHQHVNNDHIITSSHHRMRYRGMAFVAPQWYTNVAGGSCSCPPPSSPAIYIYITSSHHHIITMIHKCSWRQLLCDIRQYDDVIWYDVMMWYKTDQGSTHPQVAPRDQPLLENSSAPAPVSVYMYRYKHLYTCIQIHIIQIYV